MSAGKSLLLDADPFVVVDVSVSGEDRSVVDVDLSVVLEADESVIAVVVSIIVEYMSGHCSTLQYSQRCLRFVV